MKNITVFPSIKHPYRFYAFPKGGLIYFVKYGGFISKVQTNLEGRDILNLCSGLNSIEKIAFLLGKKFKTQINTVNIYEFLNSISNHIEFNKTPINASNRICGNSNLFYPLFAEVQVTNRCNLKCSFCSALSNESQKQDLSSKDIIKIFNVLFNYGVKAVILTGGETMMRTDIKDLIIKALFLFDSVLIQTNGTILSDDVLELVSNHNDKIGFSVSIDGSEKYHDMVRGHGTYKKIISTLKRLRERNVVCLIVATVSSDNISEIEKIKDIADTFTQGRLRTNLLLPVGRAKINSPEYTEEFLCKYNNIKSNYNATIEFDNTKELKLLWDYIGSMRLAISSRGDVYPATPLFTFSELKYGNILKDDFREIYAKMSPLWSGLTPPKRKFCKNCNLYEICKTSANSMYALCDRRKEMLLYNA